MKTKTRKPQGFTASLRQIAVAYEQHFGKPQPGNETYQWAANEIIKDIGFDSARKLILSIPNVA